MTLKLKVKVKVNMSILNQVSHHEDAWGSGGIAPRTPNLGNRWMRLVSFTPRPPYSQGKSPQYPLDRWLGGPQSRSGRGNEEKEIPFPPLSGIEPGRSTRSLVTTVTELRQFPKKWKYIHIVETANSTELHMKRVFNVLNNFVNSFYEKNFIRIERPPQQGLPPYRSTCCGRGGLRALTTLKAMLAEA
jgi:hypothetical protein